MAAGADGGTISRRSVLKGAGLLAGTGIAGAPALLAPPRAAAQAAGSGKPPLRLGFQVHRTGIGAVYGRWYERTTTAAAALINEQGGIDGRKVEIVAEDDGTDPKRGAEVVEKLATQHKVDFIFGTLFSHVVIGSAPRAGRAEDPVLRGQRGLPRRVGEAQPVRLPAGHHRRAGAGDGHLGLGDEEPRQEDHDDLPRLRLRLRPPRLLLEGGHGPGRADRGADPDPAHRVLLHPVLPPGAGRHRGDLPRHGRAGRAHLRQGDGRALRGASGPSSSATSTRWRAWTSRAPASSTWRGATSGRPSRATPASTRRPTSGRIGSGSASTRTGPASRTRRTCPRTPTCSAAGRRSTSSSRRSRRRATRRRRTTRR